MVLMGLFLSGCGNESIKSVTQDYQLCFSTEQCSKIIKVKIQRNWHRPDVDPELSATVSINLGENGIVQSVTIEDPSGNSSLDESAIEAVKGASPFSELTGLTTLEYEKFKKIAFSFAPMSKWRYEN